MQNRFIPDMETYKTLARQAAAEGAVLLKNDGQALPFHGGEKISVFGRNQFNYYKSGTGSGGMVNTRYTVGILDALKEEDLILSQHLMDVCQTWLKDHPYDTGNGWAQEPWSQQEMPLLSDELIIREAAESDAALILIGRTAGEDQDARNEPGSFLLTDTEEQMLEKVCRIFSRTIVLLNTGNIIDMKWVKKYDPLCRTVCVAGRHGRRARRCRYSDGTRQSMRKADRYHCLRHCGLPFPPKISALRRTMSMRKIFM